MFPNLFVNSASEEALAGHDQFENVIVEATDFARFLAFLGIPEADFFVAPCGADPFSIVAESDREHRARMSGVTGFQITGPGIVHARGAVAARRSQARAVAAPGHRHDPIRVLLN